MTTNVNIILFAIIFIKCLQEMKTDFQGDITRDNTLINTNVGTIHGMRASDGNYTMFTGIPYAEVNKDNPFGPSNPYPQFAEVYEAVHDAAVCPQTNIFLGNAAMGTLDCLQLNIYVPDAAIPTNPLPVMVWIHGGAFTLGDGNRQTYGPSLIVKHDVILVTINYRLGVYGYMCLHTPEVPGNQGLKDQLLAFRWLKDNIEFFGGDVTKMTLFGQSAGAMSAHLHMISPQEDFFDKYILQSGSAFTPDVIIDADTTLPIRIAENLGFTTTNLNEALSYISQADVHSVLEATSQTDAEFWPCVEMEHPTVEGFVVDYPINLEAPKLQNKSVLLGFTDDETIVVLANMPEASFETTNTFSNYMDKFFNFDEGERQKLTSIVTNFYLGGKSMSSEVIHELADFRSDFVFNYAVDRCVEPFLDSGANELYYYVFSYVGERNMMKELLNVTIGGAAHSDELGYMFDMFRFPEDPTPEDQLMIDRFTTMWTNFAKHGDPTPETNSLLPVKWEPITKGSPKHYMDLNSELTMGTNPFHHRMSFWDLFYDAHRESQIGYGGTDNAAVLNRVSKLYIVLTIFWCLLRS